MKLPLELQQKIIAFLKTIPNIYDSNSQRALLYQAGLDATLQNQIIIGRPPAEFIPLLISTLTSYGRLGDGRDALEAVLEAAKGSVGYERQELCNNLIAEYQSHHNESERIPSRPDKKIKILFLGTNPAATSRLKLDEEVKKIHTNLKLSQARENLELSQEWAVTIETLMQAILDESPQIVQFSGHGTQDGIILQDESGNPKIVTSEGLVSLFKLFQNTIECVILNACYSEQQAKAIRKHIPYVIGMKTGISDKAAIAFSTGFYKAIGAGKDIPFAFSLGKTAIQLEGVPDEDIPLLL